MILALLVHRPHVILAGLSQATAWLVSLAVICSRRAGSGHGPFPLHLRLLWHAQPAAAAVVAVPALWYWSVGPEIIPLLVSTAVELLCVAVLDWELVTSWQKDRSDAEEQLLHDDGMVIRVQRVKLPCHQVMKHFRFISNAFLHEKPCVKVQLCRQATEVQDFACTRYKKTGAAMCKLFLVDKTSFIAM